jgi:predicted deacetylase
VVSFHDLTPDTQPECEWFLEQARAAGVARCALLAIPCRQGGPAFTESRRFVRWLRDRASEGHEVCVHGFTHAERGPPRGPLDWFYGRLYTDREHEFFAADGPEARARVRAGAALFRQAGLPVRGFVAPAWLLSRGARDVLAAEGFEYSATINHIHLLRPHRRLLAPSLVCSARSPWRRHVSIGWLRWWGALQRRRAVLRLAVHPTDLRHDALRRALLASLAGLAARRRPCTYADVACGVRSAAPCT